MGSSDSKVAKPDGDKKSDYRNNLHPKKEQEKLNKHHYDQSVKEIAHLAQSLKKNDRNINIELAIECDNLPKMDIFGLCDPLVEVYFKESEDEDQHFLGRTEIIPNSLNPKFSKTFIRPYSFNQENRRFYRFIIYDADNYELNSQGGRYQKIGEVRCTDHQIMNSGRHLQLDIDTSQSYKGESKITITATQYESSTSSIAFQLIGREFSSKHGLFVKIEVMKSSWQEVAATNILENVGEQELKWDIVKVGANKFQSDGDKRVGIRLRLYEFSKKGISEIGNTDSYSLEQYLNLSEDNNNLRIVQAGLVVGTVQTKIREIKKQKESTDPILFLNYMYSGNQLNLMIAIDFSKATRKYHYPQQNQENLYIKALEEVVGLLQFFDKDKAVQCYGFGAVLPPRYSTVSHLFSLNGNYFKPFITEGIGKVIEHYKNTLDRIKLHGPSIFSEVVDKAIQHAEYKLREPGQLQYTVLVIITDGVVSDQAYLKQRVARASTLPISIVTICVSQVRSKFLVQLDADQQYEVKDGIKDIVQHIHLEEFRSKEKSMLLPYQILEEIPRQYLKYMVSIGHQPPFNLHKLKDQFFEEKTSSYNSIVNIPQYLLDQQSSFSQKASRLTAQPKFVQAILNEGIMAKNLQYMIELVGNRMSQAYHDGQHRQGLKAVKEQANVIKHKIFRIKEYNKLDEALKRKMEEKYEERIIFLHRRQKLKPPEHISMPQPAYDKQSPPDYSIDLSQYRTGSKLCTLCRKCPIDMLLLPCGHSCTCHNQSPLICPQCRCRVVKQLQLQ